MRNITISLVALFGLLSPAMAAGPNINPATQINWTKVAGAGTPSASCVASIYGEPYTNTTNGDFYVCASTGWVLVAAGGGGTVTGSGTAGFVPLWATSASLGNSLLDYGITNALKFTFSKGIVVSDGSGEAGVVGIKQGTAVSNTTNYVTLTGPTSITAYRIQLPGTAPTSGNTYLSCTAADPAVCTWAAGGGSGPTLQTNGTPNGSQTLLNLAQGSNVTLTDNGTGTVTIAASGGGGGGYTNVTGTVSQTTVSALNTLCGTGTLYVTTPLSIATGGTITCPTEFSKSGLMTIASGQTVTFSKPIIQTDAPSQIFAGSGVAVMSIYQARAYTAWWGDVADFTIAGGAPTGTDDTAPINACITAMSNGSCFLLAQGHKITGPITLNKGNVILEGPQIGGSVNWVNNPLVSVPNRAFLAQVTSATNGVNITSAGCCIIGTGMRHVDVYSTNIAATASAGVNVSNVQGLILNDVHVSDFINDFNFGHTAGIPPDQTDGLIAGYGYFITGGPNYGSVNLCGFNFSNTSANGYQSSYFSHLAGYIANGVHGTATAATICLSGSIVNDLNVDHWESAAAMDYGLLVTTTGAGFTAYDLNFTNGVADTQTISGVKVDTFGGQQLNLGKFVCNGMGNSTKCVDIQSSSNVYIDGVTCMNSTSSLTSVTCVNAASSSNLTIKNINPQNNNFFRGTSVAFSGVTNSVIDGNIKWTDTHTGVALTSTSTANVITGSINGQGTGVSFDATSGTNAVWASFGSTLTTGVSDSGTGNRWCDNSACAGLGATGPVSAALVGTNGSSAIVAATGHAVATTLACADTSGSGTVQACTTSPSFTPASGDCINYTTTTSNSGAGLTLNVNSLGAKSVAYQGSTTLASGYVAANKPKSACYDGTNWNLGTTDTATGSAFITSLTTTGTSGAATVTSGVLNIPQYTGGGSSFPYTIYQEFKTHLSACTTCTVTFPRTAQSSGATLWMIIAGDGSSTFTAPSGWTTDINQAQATYSRLAVIHITSAGQTSAAFTYGSASPTSVYFFELSGARTLDVNSASGSANANTILLPAITPTAGSLVFSAACFVTVATTYANASPNLLDSNTVAETMDPNWRAFSIGGQTSGDRSLAGFTSTIAATNTSTTPPILNYPVNLFGSGGVAWATFSIK